MQANEEKLLKILNEKSDDGTDWDCVQKLWKQGQDEAKLNSSQFSMVLNEEFEAINNISSLNDLVDIILKFAACEIGVPLKFYSDPDQKDSDFMWLSVDRNNSGIGLQERDIYFDNNMDVKREAYKKYLVTITNHLKEQVKAQYLEGDTSEVYKLEETLAHSFMKLNDRREPYNIYNPHTLAQLESLCPNIEWKTVIKDLGIELKQDQFVCVTEVAFLKELNSCLSEVSLNTWKHYLSIRLLTSLGNHLDDTTAQIVFDFYGKIMSGQLEQKPRWKRVYYKINSLIGEVVGKRYVEEHFPSESKAQVLDMVNRMKVVLGKRIKSLNWMGEETKLKALEKLETFSVKIGYPQKWIDHSSLTLSKEHYCKNVYTCSKWVYKEDLAKCYKPVDKALWPLTPQTVNACYDPTRNEITFPAGIIQPPMYDKSASLAYNFGGIGAVICHEITHGFDDQGAKYDHLGNLKNWWTDDDKKRFDECSEKLKVQFCDYVVHGMNVKGDNCLGENIADLGGVSISLEALSNLMDEKNCKPEEKHEEMKKLFHAWAVIWRNNITEEEAKRRIILDPHSPGHLRVNGILKNVDAFYDLFEVKCGDAMFLEVEKRSKIW